MHLAVKIMQSILSRKESHTCHQKDNCFQAISVSPSSTPTTVKVNFKNINRGSLTNASKLPSNTSITEVLMKQRKTEVCFGT